MTTTPPTTGRPSWASSVPLDWQLTHLRIKEQSTQSVALMVARACLEIVPEAAEASMTVVVGRAATTVAWTGLVAYELDEGQYGAGRGPCLEAARTGLPQLMTDARAEVRWPAFAERAIALGTLSCAAVPVPPMADLRAAVNLYGLAAGALGADVPDRVAGHLGEVGLALSNVADFARSRQDAETLVTAMEGRAVIEQAKGVLMAQQRITAVQAFEQLSADSQLTNVKVSALAAEVVRAATS